MSISTVFSVITDSFINFGSKRDNLAGCWYAPLNSILWIWYILKETTHFQRTIPRFDMKRILWGNYTQFSFSFFCLLYVSVWTVVMMTVYSNNTVRKNGTCSGTGGKCSASGIIEILIEYNVRTVCSTTSILNRYRSSSLLSSETRWPSPDYYPFNREHKKRESQ